MKNTLIHTMITLLLFLGLSCTKDDGKNLASTDQTTIIENTSNQVILKTYENFSTKAAALQTACEALKANPSELTLTNARNAWKESRIPWEQSEGFLFGPVDQEGIDPSVDAWPVNVTDLNNVLSSTNALTVSFLEQQEGTLKGFHTIEFLLWGANSDKIFSQITVREQEYLQACAGALAKDAKKLYDLWRPGSGNYIDKILKAGKGSNVYISQKAAIEELANAMVGICDEVGNGKINDPLTSKDLTLEESRFSNNSKADFSDNIRSIEHIYLGTYNGAGNGSSISALVKSKNAALDETIRLKISAAINDIVNIPGTFTTAVIQNEASVKKAQTSVRNLQETLEAELVPLISKL